MTTFAARPPWRCLARPTRFAHRALVPAFVAASLAGPLTPTFAASAPGGHLQPLGWRGAIDYVAQSADSAGPTPQTFLKVNGRTSLVSSFKNSFSRHDAIALGDGAATFTSHAERHHEETLSDRGIWDCGAARPNINWASDATSTVNETADATGPASVSISVADGVYTLTAVVPQLRGKRVQSQQTTRSGQCKDSDNGTTTTSATSDMTFEAFTISQQAVGDPDQPDVLDGQVSVAGPGSATIAWRMTRSSSGCEVKKVRVSNRGEILSSTLETVRGLLQQAQDAALSDARNPLLITVSQGISQAMGEAEATRGPALLADVNPDLAYAQSISTWLSTGAPELANTALGMVIGVDGRPDPTPGLVGQQLLGAQQLGESLVVGMAELIAAQEQLTVCQSAVEAR